MHGERAGEKEHGEEVTPPRFDGTRAPRPRYRATLFLEAAMGRGLLLWLLGIPLPIILLIWLFGGLS